MFVRAFLKERQREYKKKVERKSLLLFFLYVCARVLSLSLFCLFILASMYSTSHFLSSSSNLYTMILFQTNRTSTWSTFEGRESERKKRQSNISWLWIHRHHYKISLIVNIQVQSILHSIVRYLSIQRTISQVNDYSIEKTLGIAEGEEKRTFMSREMFDGIEILTGLKIEMTWFPWFIVR